MPQQKRQLAAIMFTDIVGYTALMGSDEKKAFEVLRKNRIIHKPIITKYQGKFLKEIGDGILASFDTASDAVRCAGAIQNQARKEDIELRIGIHLGEVVFQEGDVLGDGVNVASRLEEMAEAGCIYISGTIYKNVKNKEGIKTEFIEEKTLKNVDEPVKVYKVECEAGDVTNSNEQQQPKSNKLPYYIIAGLVVVIAVILIWQFIPKKETHQLSLVESPDKTIAVLPFYDDSPSKDNEYFCNGMMEEILNQLQKISALKVKSRTAVEPYRNTSKTFETIAKELDVNFIVEGSVRKSGEDLRITSQLIDVKTGDHLWSETYDGKYTEKIFEFQSNVANQVAASMGAVITQDEEQRIEAQPVEDIKAYDYYIRGEHEVFKYEGSRDKSRLKEAHLLLDKSLEINPRDVRALHLKAHVLSREGDYDSVLVYADRILEIEPESGLAYQLKGDYYYYSAFDVDLTIEYYQKSLKHLKNEEIEYRKWGEIMLAELFCLFKNDYRKGLSYYQKGLDMESQYLEAGYLMLGLDLGYIGEYEKAEKYLQKSLDQKVSCLGIAHLAQALMYQSKFNEALDFLDTMCEPLCIANCNKMKFYIYFGQKNYDLAEDYAPFVNVGGPPYFGDSTFLAYVYYQQGKDKLAESVINKIKNSLQNQLTEDDIMHFTKNLRLSYLYAILNENQEALKHLSQAIDEFVLGAFDYFVVSNPIFEKLRDDPEFQAIVKRVLDEKAAIRAQIQQMIDSGEINL